MNRRSLRLEGSSCLLEVKIKDFFIHGCAANFHFDTDFN